LKSHGFSKAALKFESRYRRLAASAATLAADDLEVIERHALPDAGPKI
jgi:hypothetical protein